MPVKKTTMTAEKPAPEKTTVKKPAAAAKKPAAKKTAGTMYRSKKLSLYHPYQNIRFNPGVPTACKLDVWLKAQIKAGLIE